MMFVMLLRLVMGTMHLANYIKQNKMIKIEETRDTILKLEGERSKL